MLSTGNLSNAFADASGVTGTGPVTVPGSNNTGIPDWLKKGTIILGPVGLPASGALPHIPTSASEFISSRVGAFILGLILIAGGIYLFKPVQQAANKAAKAALL